jgi:hypothetical protein
VSDQVCHCCFAEFTVSRPGAAQRAGSAAAAGVKKALGLQPAPRAGRGAGHYLVAFAAPLGAVALFAFLAVALSQKVGTEPGFSKKGVFVRSCQQLACPMLLHSFQLNQPNMWGHIAASICETGTAFRDASEMTHQH